MGVRLLRPCVCVTGLLLLTLTHSAAYNFREKNFRTAPYYRQYGGFFRRDDQQQLPPFTTSGNGDKAHPGDQEFPQTNGISLANQQADGGLFVADKRSAMLQELAKQLKSRPREKGGFTFRFGKRETRE